MARPREFDSDLALEKAMQVFWTKGYEATSLSDLLSAMGISKSSFYATFGSKHELFLATLDRYSETRGASLVAILESARSPRQGIATVLEEAFRATDGECRRGCFVNNCAVEVAPHDQLVARRVAQGHARMEEAFHRAVKAGQKAGEITKDQPARALARFLNNSLAGLSVMGEGGAERATLDDALRVTLSALD